ncbi:SHOCT-like domain-containing protein [Anaerolentibacter hominis]|uniref:SHOCT-like domain-containing protein n=1 Tax=Anaerolentibacter hominis TaxID=3079009 RepID=UPI0031B809AB
MDEKMRILKMVEEGKLTAQQAVNLINALEEDRGKEASVNYMEPVAECSGSEIPYDNKMLRIIVDSPDGDKVNIQLPVKIIRHMLKLTGMLPIKSEELQGVDLEALAGTILDCLDSETIGNIVSVDGADGTNVKIYIG